MIASLDLRELAQEAEALAPWVTERRRHLHRHPELSFREEKTAQYLRHELMALGYHPSEPVAGRHGFYVDLKSAINPDEFIVLRADMDALPIFEENDVEFRSTVDGVGHLCGHDAHSAMLLGAAALLRDRAAELPVSVRFVFQHAEEVPPGGAKDFVDAGLVKRALGCFGIHVTPRLDVGQVGILAGETMAAAGMFFCTIRGSGGHGAAPHEAIDPVPCAAAAVLNLQQIISRRVPFHKSAVVSVCTINGGTAPNVIPDEVKLTGTFRAFDMKLFGEMERRIEEIIVSTARAYECEAEVRIDRGYPALVNDPAAVAASRAAITRLFGDTAVAVAPATMGGEDFAYFAQARPSSFAFLGVRKPGAGEYHPLHHARFLPVEEALWRGVALSAAMPYVALEYLKR
jgi:amidohydrolase